MDFVEQLRVALGRRGKGRGQAHRIRVEIGCVSEQVYQLLTGLLMLARNGSIDLDLRVDPRQEQRPSPHVVEATIDGGVRLFYDMLDGYNVDRSVLETSLARSDFYFKRSFDERRNAEFRGGERIRPYGFNYPVALPRPLLLRLEWAGAAAPRDRVRAVLGSDLPRHTAFEQGPDVPATQRRAVFISRVWNPHEGADDRQSTERVELNALRASCVRALRRELGPSVIAGLAPSPYALQHYRDCVLDAWLRRAQFIATVKASEVGIATRGLHHSNPWSVGEYVAAARGVVSERLAYTVPGDFTVGVNYAEFASPEACVEQTASLLADDDALARMKRANHAYYQSYLRPDRLVGRTIEAALGAGKLVVDR
jgi:hypothetical protein